MQILAEVFWGAGNPTGAELVRPTGIPQQTVSREVARLEQAGVLVTEPVGTAKTIRPAPGLPYGPVLRQLLAYAGGVIPMLARAFGDNPAISAKSKASPHVIDVELWILGEYCVDVPAFGETAENQGRPNAMTRTVGRPKPIAGSTTIRSSSPMVTAPARIHPAPSASGSRR